MAVSIVCPMHNEAENVEPLVREIREACAAIGEFEVILVDDGSTDDTAARIERMQGEFDGLRLLQHPVAGGQSAAVHSGVSAARGDIVCTLDGDLQNPPSEIPRLVAPFLAPDAPARLGLVAGQRARRRDSWSKRAASRFANGLRSRILSDGTRDTGCGLKAFRRDAFLALPYFNHMHRFLPALFARHGWEIAHIDVAHRARGGGVSKYNNLHRALVGIHDLIGVAWLLRRAKTVQPVERSAAAPEVAPNAAPQEKQEAAA
ncbi:glycosyltransferase family 2 protein [Psychromarinibacter sp. C21-152]|uniref:Glycosyltransferase family 2 protein n=1 Tax=Psychromarinibacter sediminicola TaxID=3033385 RepID=A0AAE3NVI5_9RHOB|nr:glycosyltransferase family 2 protein [Psychromarinibacter sediminicola]MDF0602444.1 glycosyltransferase family 2 protein [Psychromarinibacter sediminicola]